MEASGVATRLGASLGPPPRLRRGEQVQVAVIAACMLFALLALPALLSGYWIDTSTEAVVYAIVAAGLGLLVGRVGMISLGQVAVLALGAWVGAKICFSTGLPYPILLLASGRISKGWGTPIRLPP